MKAKEKDSYHKILADYFVSKYLYLDEPTQEQPNTRKLVEQPWQQAKALMWEELLDTLNSFEFVGTKIKTFKLYDLYQDYIFSLDCIPHYRPERMTFETWLSFLGERNHHLQKGNEEWPVNRILLQLAIEDAENSIVTKSAEDFLNKKSIPWTWIIPLSRPSQKQNDSCLFSIGSFFNNNTEIFNNHLSVSENSNNILFTNLNNEFLIADINKRKIVTRIKYDNTIINTVFLQSGNFIIGDNDGSIKTGSINKPEEIKQLSSFNRHDIKSITFSTDGKYAFINRNDENIIADIFGTGAYEIEIWDILKNQKITGLNGHTDNVDLLLPIGEKILVSASGNSIPENARLKGIEITIPTNLKVRKYAIIVWNLNLLEEVRVLSGHTKSISSVVYAGNDRLISLSDTIRFWNWTNLQKPCYFELDNSNISAIATSDNQILFITGKKDGTITLFNTKEGYYTQMGTHEELIQQIKVSPDNKYIISVSVTKIKIWDIAKAVSLIKKETGIKNKNWNNRISVSNYSSLKLIVDGIKFPIAGNPMNEVIYANLENSQNDSLQSDYLVINRDKHEKLASFWINKSGNSLKLDDSVFTLKCFPSQVGKDFTKNVKSLQKYSGIITKVNNRNVFEFNIDAKSDFSTPIVVEDKNLLIYKNGKDVVIHNYYENSSFTVSSDEDIASVAYSSFHLIIGVVNGDIAIFKISNNEEINEITVLRSHLGSITDLKVMQNKSLLISTSIDGTIKVWDMIKMSLKFTLVSHQDFILSVEFAPGDKLLSGSEDKSIIYWDLKDGRKIREFTGHNSGVSHISVHPDGKYFVSASKDGEIRKWTFNSGNPVYIFQKLNRPFSKLQMAYSSSILLALSKDVIKVYDLNLLKEIYSLNNSPGNFPSGTAMKDYSPDDERPSALIKPFIKNSDFRRPNRRIVSNVLQYRFLNAIITYNQLYFVTLKSSNIIELRCLSTGILIAKLFSETEILDCIILSDNENIVTISSNNIRTYRILYSNELFNQAPGKNGHKAQEKPNIVKSDETLNWEHHETQSDELLAILRDFISEKPSLSLSDKQFENILHRLKTNQNSQTISSVLFSNHFKLINPNIITNCHPAFKAQMNDMAKSLRFSFDKLISEYKILLLNSLQAKYTDLVNSIYSIINELIVLNKISEAKLLAQDQAGNILFFNHEVVEIIESWLGKYGVILEYNQWTAGSTLGSVECQLSYWQMGQIFRINSGLYDGLFQFQNKIVIPGIEILSMVLQNRISIDGNSKEVRIYESNEDLLSQNQKKEKEIADYLKLKEYETKYQRILDDAEKAFQEENWEEAYQLYIKLVQQGKFDPDYLRFNMAVCRINEMKLYDQMIVSDIEYLIKLLNDNGAQEKAQTIAEKLKERIDNFKNEELLKKNAQKPWWKNIF